MGLVPPNSSELRRVFPSRISAASQSRPLLSHSGGAATSVPGFSQAVQSAGDKGRSAELLSCTEGAALEIESIMRPVSRASSAAVRASSILRRSASARWISSSDLIPSVPRRSPFSSKNLPNRYRSIDPLAKSGSIHLPLLLSNESTRSCRVGVPGTPSDRRVMEPEVSNRTRIRPSNCLVSVRITDSSHAGKRKAHANIK